jgi:hypothetical protein
MNLRASRWSMLLVVVTMALPSLAAAQPACQPGRYASGATGTCEECNAGLYQPANGQTACFSCEAGRFTDTPARTACDACGPGRYQGFAGATVRRRYLPRCDGPDELRDLRTRPLLRRDRLHRVPRVRDRKVRLHARIVLVFGLRPGLRRGQRLHCLPGVRLRGNAGVRRRGHV